VTVKTCAVCGGATYDADPIVVQTFGSDAAPVRVWLCSPECAWKGGRKLERNGVGRATLGTLQSLFKVDGLEVLAPRSAVPECKVCNRPAELDREYCADHRGLATLSDPGQGKWS